MAAKSVSSLSLNAGNHTWVMRSPFGPESAEMAVRWLTGTNVPRRHRRSFRLWGLWSPRQDDYSKDDTKGHGEDVAIKPPHSPTLYAIDVSGDDGEAKTHEHVNGECGRCHLCYEGPGAGGGEGEEEHEQCGSYCKGRVSERLWKPIWIVVTGGVAHDSICLVREVGCT